MLPLLLSALLSLAPQQPAAAASGLAPDGQRGLSGSSVSQLMELMRNRRGEDLAFLEELRALPVQVRQHQEDLRAHYMAWGAFELLPTGAKAEVRALHKAYVELERSPFTTLARGDRRARILARMLTDLRFRLRAHAGTQAAEEAEELERALAVLRGAAEGFVLLSDVEAAVIAQRADIAASRLRALRHDLSVLRPGEAPGEGDPSATAELLALATQPEGQRSEAWRDKLDELGKLAARMQGGLFDARLASGLAQLLAGREEDEAHAKRMLDEARAFLPDTPEGAKAPEEIRKLKRHERIRAALYRAREGLQYDPMDAELTWIAAHSADFLNGTIESRPLYDRFLVLRGIRYYDHSTLSKRKLDARETEALSAVQRPPELRLPGEGG